VYDWATLSNPTTPFHLRELFWFSLKIRSRLIALKTEPKFDICPLFWPGALHALFNLYIADNDQTAVENNSDDVDLLRERDASIRILENLTGKINLNKRKNEQTKNKTVMVRYDPNKEESKELEVNNQIKKTKMTRDKGNRRPDEDAIEEAKQADQHIDLNKFYDIKSDLKNAFNSNELFTFKFASSTRKTNENNDQTSKKSNDQNSEQKFKSYNYLNDNMYKSSSESEFHDDDDDDDDDENLMAIKSNTNAKPDTKRLFVDKRVEFNETSFIPELNDKQVQGSRFAFQLTGDAIEKIKKFFLLLLFLIEALAFFQCTKDDEVLRSEWSKIRETLVLVSHFWCLEIDSQRTD
jgi:hypothetical protein